MLDNLSVNLSKGVKLAPAQFDNSFHYVVAVFGK